MITKRREKFTIWYLEQREKKKRNTTYPCDILEMFLVPRRSQEPPWYYTRCEPLLEEESTQSAGKDKRHAFRKGWYNIIGTLIYRFRDGRLLTGFTHTRIYQSKSKSCPCTPVAIISIPCMMDVCWMWKEQNYIIYRRRRRKKKEERRKEREQLTQTKSQRSEIDHVFAWCTWEVING